MMNYKISNCRLSASNNNYFEKKLDNYAEMYPEHLIVFGKIEAGAGISITHKCKKTEEIISQESFGSKDEMMGYVIGYLKAQEQKLKDSPHIVENAYVAEQFAKIKLPNLTHIAGAMQIVGDVEGKTNWLNVSADQFDAIRKIMIRG